MIKFFVFLTLIINFISNSISNSNKSLFDSELNTTFNSLMQDATTLNFNTIYKYSDSEKKYVLHAGGELEGYTYLNNLEAVRNSYEKGFRMIELDIELTSDNIPVLIHSWDGFVNKFFGEPDFKVYSFEEFKNFKMVNGWHQLTLDSILYYMQTEFPEMYLITDTKVDNKSVLNYIVTNHPNMMNRIIPQVYSQDEYIYAKNLGFKKIIYTLYKSSDTLEEIVEFCKEYNPYAITMNKDWANSELPKKLDEIGIYTYAHTIDNLEDYEALKANGIKGIYTNKLFEQ